MPNPLRLALVRLNGLVNGLDRATIPDEAAVSLDFARTAGLGDLTAGDLRLVAGAMADGRAEALRRSLEHVTAQRDVLRVRCDEQERAMDLMGQAAGERVQGLLAEVERLRSGATVTDLARAHAALAAVEKRADAVLRAGDYDCDHEAYAALEEIAELAREGRS